jgi:hypothetical protein
MIIRRKGLPVGTVALLAILLAALMAILGLPTVRLGSRVSRRVRGFRVPGQGLTGR